MSRKLLGIAGWKNSGKTTLTVRLVTELTRRGFRIATIKHAHHDADVDHEGTDSFRHRLAGASEVALVTARRWALMHELSGDPEPTLADIVAKLSPADLIVVEGFKREPIPRIEVRRIDAASTEPLPEPDATIAIASDTAVAAISVPWFNLDDVGVIADFVVKHFEL